LPQVPRSAQGLRASHAKNSVPHCFLTRSSQVCHLRDAFLRPERSALPN